MGTWHTSDTYVIDASASGLELQRDAAVFWERVFQKLLAEEKPYARVMIETGWDGPRYVVYAVEMNRKPGYDTGWRIQCILPDGVRKSDRWILFLAGAGRAPADRAYRALKRTRAAVTFWRSEYGQVWDEQLPL